jgi:hypothetical protein
VSELERATITLSDLVTIIDGYLTQIPEGEYYGEFALAHLNLDHLMRSAARMQAEADRVRQQLE